MVLGGAIQRMNEAQRAEIERVMLGHAEKLSRKDFIKKFTSDTFFMGKAADEKWWAGTAKIGTAEDAAAYYDTIIELKKEPKDEAKDYVEDLNKLSKNNFIKKHNIFTHPDYSYKFSKNYYRQLAFEHICGGIKNIPISKEKALKAIKKYNRAVSGSAGSFVDEIADAYNPFTGFGLFKQEGDRVSAPGVIHQGQDKPIEVIPNEDILGRIWEANKKKSKKFETLKKILSEAHINISMFEKRFYDNFIKGSEEDEEDNEIKTKKTTSSKSKNLADELKELKKLYKDGTLSKEEFTKAKNKLLK